MNKFRTAPMPGPTRLSDGPGVWCLVVVFSVNRAKRGISIALSENSITLGRDEAADLHLDDDQVSRNHASLEVDQHVDKPVISDLGSFNGTFVNGQRITTKPLNEGDIVRVGSHMLMTQFLNLEEWKQLELTSRLTSSIKGRSNQTLLLLDRIEEVAPLDLPVLIQGESGVGKELVAEELHHKSGRSGAFVPVNCAALAENLVESELFGHVKGAFTGADRMSEGLFGEAERGTLFLDEIGEMPLPMQAKLLRVLARGEVRPVGGTQSRTIDVRVVAATNVDLEKAIEGKSFRHDLYARLLGVVIEVPPLNQRRDDIITLTEHFLTLNSNGIPISPDAAEALLIHDWRFNVRELEQIIRIASVTATRKGQLELIHLPRKLHLPFKSRSGNGTEAPRAQENPPPLHVSRRAVPNAGELKAVLCYYKGNISHVADFFGKDRRQVYRWATKLDIDLKDFRDDEDEEKQGCDQK